MDTGHPAMNVGALADFDSHRIEGYAEATGEYISVPLYSNIVDNLWMGGAPVDALPKEFRYAVNLYGSDYRVHRGQTVIYSLMDDSVGQSLEREHLLSLAQCIKRFMATGPTLVHCQAGLNRSGLLCALTLMLHGLDAKSAIAILREKRCAQVLCNSHFAHWLQLEGERMRNSVVSKP